MIENGWPITDVSAIVGHANVAITLQVYAHVVKRRTQSAGAMQNRFNRWSHRGFWLKLLDALVDAGG